MGKEQIYDVAIIGGGLAGLTLAIQCTDAGQSVILFEKEQYPFNKVCGEYISNESAGFLQRLGVPLEGLHLPQISKLNISDAKGRLYNFKLPLGGFGISRYTLDNMLYNIALKKGACVFAQTKATNVELKGDYFYITANGQGFKAKCAVGSFGKRSNFDVIWKRPFAASKPTRLNNYIGVKYHVQYKHEPDVIALHNFSNGYCGISQIEDGKCCLCYLTTAKNLQRSSNSIKQMENDILCKNPQLKTIFSEAVFLYKQPIAISQISFSPKSQVQNHVLMAGDAAGMITPLCGNGMSMAMHAGKLAFENITLYLDGKASRQAMEENYTNTWQKHFSKRLFTGRVVQRMFGGDTPTSLFLWLMHKNTWLAQKIISSTHGTPY